MKWLPALLLGGILAFVLPLTFGGQEGFWMTTWTKWGTIRPIEGSPGFLFSLPIFVGGAIIFRMFFIWHSR